MQNFLAAREISGLQFSSTNTDMVQKLIPKLSSTVDTFQSKAYAAQFSTDGNYCWVSTQDHEVHFYDSQFNRRFQVQATVGQWSITDCQLSSNNKFLAYSSITPFIHLAKISEQADESTAQECLDLSRSHSQFGIWSLKLLDDGTKIMAGTSAHSIIVYDVETKKTQYNILGHEDDVNSVCFAESSSPNILISGSDDSYIKIWDTRSIARHQASGVLVGHTEGISCVSAKGDGRYLLSNSKDQTMKYWDLRKLITPALFESKACRVDLSERWDYRWMRYPRNISRTHPFDCSIKTYRGHKVLKTLIRCYFSPKFSTGQRFGYTGSTDGIIHIYDLNDDDIVHTINTSQPENTATTQNMVASVNINDADQEDDDNDEDEAEAESDYETISQQSYPESEENNVPSIAFNSSREEIWNTVRDVSWHPYDPIIISSQWGLSEWGRANNGAIMKHVCRI